MSDEGDQGVKDGQGGKGMWGKGKMGKDMPVKDILDKDWEGHVGPRERWIAEEMWQNPFLTKWDFPAPDEYERSLRNDGLN